MNRRILADRLKTISLSTALVFGAFGQGHAQESEVSIVVFLPQKGAKPGEADAAQAQAIGLFNQANHSLFFMRRGKQNTIVAIDSGIEASFEMSRSLYNTYPTIDIPSIISEFQESLSEFERNTGLSCLDPDEFTIEVHIIVEGMVLESAINQFERRVRLINGWNDTNGRLKEELNISRWRWDAENQRMNPTKN